MEEEKAGVIPRNVKKTWISLFFPKRVVKDFLIKFTKKLQKKCQKHFHAPDTQAGGSLAAT